MNFIPAFRYRLRDSVKSAVIFAGAMVLVYLLTMVSFLRIADDGDGSGSMSGFTIAAAIFMLVVGVCTPREHLRLCIQNGVSRRTAFLSEQAGYAVTALCLAVFGEVLLAVSHAVVSGDDRLVISDLYQIIYLGFGADGMTLGQHLQSVLFSFWTMLAAAALGSFISLGFYRLNKAWTILVAVGVPLFFTFGLPVLMMIPAVYSLTTRLLMALFTWLFQSVWNFCLFCMLCYAVLAGLCRWVSMRAPIRGTK